MRRLAFYAFHASLCKRTSCRIAYIILISSILFSAIPELKKFLLSPLNPFKLRIAHFVTCSPYTSQVSCLSLFHVLERKQVSLFCSYISFSVLQKDMIEYLCYFQNKLYNYLSNSFVLDMIWAFDEKVEAVEIKVRGDKS